MNNARGVRLPCHQTSTESGPHMMFLKVSSSRFTFQHETANLISVLLIAILPLVIDLYLREGSSNLNWLVSAVLVWPR